MLGFFVLVQLMQVGLEQFKPVTIQKTTSADLHRITPQVKNKLHELNERVVVLCVDPLPNLPGTWFRRTATKCFHLPAAANVL